MSPQTHLFSPEVHKFILAAEFLMIDDVTPQSLTEIDLKAIRYYVQCLSDKFCSSPPISAPTNGVEAHRSA